MMETAATILGVAATALSTVSMLPQVYRTWRTRRAADISAGWLVAALAGTAMWSGYGLLVDAPAVVWANVLTFAQFAFILAVKIKTERRLTL